MLRALWFIQSSAKTDFLDGYLLRENEDASDMTLVAQQKQSLQVRSRKEVPEYEIDPSKLIFTKTKVLTVSSFQPSTVTFFLLVFELRDQLLQF